MVVSTCRGCYWGELLATASRHRGARGIVADAYTRDTLALIEMGFPTFVAGISPEDSLGRIDVDAVGVPVECGTVSVHPGDLVIADYDGVVVVPSARAEEVVALAEEKVSGENLVREKLADGMPVSEAFRTYGVIKRRTTWSAAGGGDGEIGPGGPTGGPPPPTQKTLRSPPKKKGAFCQNFAGPSAGGPRPGAATSPRHAPGRPR